MKNKQPFVIVGLGNPGEEYENTRHNTGRIVLEAIHKKFAFSPWENDKKTKALKSQGKIGKNIVTLLMPETFMNRSGISVASLVKNKNQIHNLVVVYDDLDLGIGGLKISYNKSSGGHRGLESVIKNIKSTEFIRIRVGTSPVTPSGKIKKPKGESAVEKHILGKFKKQEEESLKKLNKKICEAIEVLVTDGLGRAMSEFN